MDINMCVAWVGGLPAPSLVTPLFHIQQYRYYRKLDGTETIFLNSCELNDRISDYSFRMYTY